MTVRLALLCFLFTASLLQAGLTPQNRARVSLAGPWQSQFVKDVTDSPAEFKEKITLPRKGMKLPKGMDALWCERSIEVPADWKDTRVFLTIDKLLYGVRIIVNEREAGELLTNGGQLDLTPHITFGKANTIRLFFGRGGQGIRSLDLVSKGVYDSFKLLTKTMGWDKGESFTGLDCLEDQFFLESVPTSLFISDVWYRSTTRGYPRLSPEITVHAEKTIKDARVQVTLFEDKTDTVALQKTFSGQTLTPGENKVNVTLRTDTLKLWFLGEPNLYRGQVSILDSDGTVLDQSNLTTFGLREFWALGKNYYMNGVKVNFVIDWAGKDNAKAMQEGHNLFYDNNHPSAGRNLSNNQERTTRELDRLGAGFMAYGVIVHDLNLSDPAVAMAYRTFVKGHTRRLRNHPSVLFYGLAMNMGGGWQNFSPEIIGQQDNIEWNHVAGTIGMQTHKELDPTRLVYFHGGSRLGEVQASNIYFNHTPIQEVEDWLLEWSAKGDRPLAVLEFMGAPLVPDYLKGMASFVTEYDARLRGDSAYKDEIDSYVDYTWKTLPTLKSLWDYQGVEYAPSIVPGVIDGHRRSIRTWRFLGAPLHSWVMKPKKNYTPGPSAFNAVVYEEMKKCLTPVQLWIGGPKTDWTSRDHNFTVGETIEKSLVGFRDENGSANWSLTWTVSDTESKKNIMTKKDKVVLGAYARVIRPFSFTAPAVNDATNLRLSLVVRDAKTNALLGQDSATLTVLPRQPRFKDLSSFAMIDPVRETSDWLYAQGINVTPFTGATTPKVLMIGKGALSTMTALPFTAGDIENGLRVVIFEQRCAGLQKIGLRPADTGTRKVFPRRTDHPLLKDLGDAMLHDWRGSATLVSPGPERDMVQPSRHIFKCGDRGTVASNVIETPQFGPFSTLFECEFDLNYSPLMIWAHGKGEVIFWQLDTAGRTATEPATTTLGKNLVAYLKSPLATPQDKTAVCLSQATEDRVLKQGFAATQNLRLLTPGHSLLVLDGKNLKELSLHRKQVVNFIKRGGEAVVLHADLAFLEDPLFAGMSTKTVRMSRLAPKAEADPLLKGVGPQTLHYRSPLDFLTVTGDKTLLKGLIAEKTLGRGRFIFIQADPAVVDNTAAVAEVKNAKTKWRRHHRERSRWHLNRLNSLLLTNLGLKSSDALTQRLFTLVIPKTFTPINEWAYLGPFTPPADKTASPLSRDLSTELSMRDPNRQLKNSRGETVSWNFPTDANNGMGMGGKMSLDQVYGVRPKDLAIATTQVWSTRARTATVQCGADWWLSFSVNGNEVFTTGSNFGDGKQGHGFHNKNVQVKLKAGWNDITCIVASGSDGHVLWFAMSNPGDLIVAQKLTAPKTKPINLPDPTELQDESSTGVEEGFSLYQGPITTENDPYRYYAW